MLRINSAKGIVIPANPGEGRGRAGVHLPERGQAAGKGTGNFLEDEKVASPHLDSRPSALLRTCFRGKDETWNDDIFIEIALIDTSTAKRI